jgi:hypothetical protein
MNYIPDFPITGIDRIINFVQDRNCPYWAIYDSDKTSDASSKGRKLYADNWKYDDETVENGARRLKAFLNDFQETGFVGYMWCKEKSGATSGGYYTGIKLSSINPQVAAIGSFPMQQPIVDVQAEIAKAIKAYEIERKLEQLENENKELRILANSETAFDRILTRLEPYSESVIKGIFNTAKAPKSITSVAGTKLQEPENVDSDEATKIAMESLQVLADGDDEIHLKLQKLAELKKNDPVSYEFAITTLNNM